MDTNKLFTMALGLADQWKVTNSELVEETKQLEIQVEFKTGSKFSCPDCGTGCPVHDTHQKSWRHLDFWQYETILRAKVPRIKCSEHGVKSVSVPWARAGSGFTLMMEAWLLLLLQQMPVNATADMVNECDTRLWRLLIHHVNKAHAQMDWSQIQCILVDETSSKRGHRYVTTVVDAHTNKLIWVGEGKSSESLKAFSQAMESHNASPSQIEIIGMDMSPAYRKGAKEFFPNAKVVFDRFHLMQMAGKALDEVRKELNHQSPLGKEAMWAIRGNEWTRSEQQQEMRRTLSKDYPRLGKALGLREMMQDILQDRDMESFRWWLNRCSWSKIKPFVTLAKTLRKHLQEIKNYFDTGLTSAAIEAINGKIQLSKRMARGYRNFENLRAISYLRASGLTLGT
jgi:transposase